MISRLDEDATHTPGEARTVATLITLPQAAVALGESLDVVRKLLKERPDVANRIRRIGPNLRILGPAEVELVRGALAARRAAKVGN
jgi:hypothetical protein